MTVTTSDNKPDDFGDEVEEKDVANEAGETTEDMKDVDLPVDENVKVNDSNNDNNQALSNTKTRWYKFDNVEIAQGYNLSGMARGAIVMSNVFLSTSFIYLANEEAGCLDEDDEVIDDCDGKAYGFEPAIIVTNIAVIAGVLSALFMPFIGAMVDYTPHRKSVGIVSAICILLIQTAQIGTISNTWLIMAFLQALAGFLFQAQVLSVYAYLPDMSYILGEETMTKHTATFVMTQFGSQTSFLFVIIVISVALGLNDVTAAQVSQGVNVFWSGSLLYFGWKLLPHVEPRDSLREGQRLVTAGFTKVFQTARVINANYKKGARWFFLAVVFAEAGANSFTIVSVVFLDEQLGLTGTEIAIFFLVTLIFTIPGSKLAAYITRKTDPRRSWQMSMGVLFAWTVGGALILDVIPAYLAFVWGCGIGLLLGWFYPTENLFFAMCLPKGKEAELAGFFVYCTQILGWLPPLIFSIMVEADVNQTYGVIAVAAFLLVAILVLQGSASWEIILEDSGRTDEVDKQENFQPNWRGK